ncbi:oxidoreductase [Lentinula aciculospora]|uniref:3-dehydrosphinganine reductase n=1 Tax=Lentinula aciculospora TaxID=153920 RepID=A0A9W9DMR4_9AGAR|nr:oxidoreductase [Lentinula aciculospora]
MQLLDFQSIILTLILSALTFALWTMRSTRIWNPRCQFCYVTGGSSGLGLAVAKALIKRGAHVTIVARNEERLANALAKLEGFRQNPDQIIRSYSFSLTDADASKSALEAASKDHGGKYPDAVFMCAGAATPGFFVEEDAQSMQKGMDNTYWVQAYTALAYTKQIVRDKTPGKLVFTCSLLGYMSMIGYSTYSPGKHALRGLAETLRSELILYDCSVHIMFPGNIDSPGYVEENRVKPKITLEIESTDKATAPEALAIELIHGIERDEFHIAPDKLSNIFRCSTIGATPHHNLLWDGFYALIGWIGLPLWRRDVDSKILNHREEHNEYLTAVGFFKTDPLMD